MKTKNILVGLIILFVLCSISSVSAADLNETQSLDNNFVATTNDDVQLTFQYDDNISSSSDSLNELKNQINKASDGSVINLNKDYSGSGDSGITIDKSLTINGQGHTIDCANLKDTYLFKSTSGKITLENLIIKNNKNSMYNYGTIYIKDNAQYTINNCTFISNTAGGGGAIYNGAKEYQLTIKNSKFINNIASDNDGGAIYSRGELNIENSYFEGNDAAMDGGAVYCDKSIDVINTTFVSNHLSSKVPNHKSYGGAIGAKGIVFVENSRFSNNVAGDLGGAIFSYSNVIIKNSSFSKNSANVGGAVYVDSSTAVISTSTFADNTAKS
ncbi:MAG: hypothetical protein U0K80_04595, partial [Methanobrevibacter sp.]|nr:hypothetical protein [Methanobrevibacter sp.]